MCGTRAQFNGISNYDKAPRTSLLTIDHTECTERDTIILTFHFQRETDVNVNTRILTDGQREVAQGDLVILTDG